MMVLRTATNINRAMRIIANFNDVKNLYNEARILLMAIADSKLNHSNDLCNLKFYKCRQLESYLLPLEPDDRSRGLLYLILFKHEHVRPA